MICKWLVPTVTSVVLHFGEECGETGLSCEDGGENGCEEEIAVEVETVEELWGGR